MAEELIWIGFSEEERDVRWEGGSCMEVDMKVLISLDWYVEVEGALPTGVRKVDTGWGLR